MSSSGYGSSWYEPARSADTPERPRSLHAAEEEFLVHDAEACRRASATSQRGGRWLRLAGPAAALLLVAGVIAVAAPRTHSAGSARGRAQASNIARELELQVKAQAFDKRLARDLADRHHHRGGGNVSAPARQEFPDMGDVSNALLDALGARAEEVAPDMSALDVANILNAYALLLNPPSAELLSALGRRAQQTAGDMGGREVARVLGAFASLGEKPQDALLEALGSRAVVVTGNMSAEDVSGVLAAYTAFDALPGSELWSALGSRAAQVMSDMDAEGVVGVLHAHAAFDQQPSKKLLGSLYQRVTEVADDMSGKDVAKAVRAYKKLGVTPGPALPKDPMWRRSVKVAKEMDAEDVTTMLTAYADWQKREAKLKAGSAHNATTTRAPGHLKGEHAGGPKHAAHHAPAESTTTSADKAGAGGMSALPPWWVLHNVKPAGTKDHGSWQAVAFSKEQQKRFGVDEDGNVTDHRVFDDAIKELRDHHADRPEGHLLKKEQERRSSSSSTTEASTTKASTTSSRSSATSSSASSAGGKATTTTSLMGVPDASSDTTSASTTKASRSEKQTTTAASSTKPSRKHGKKASTTTSSASAPDVPSMPDILGGATSASTTSEANSTTMSLGGLPDPAAEKSTVTSTSKAPIAGGPTSETTQEATSETTSGANASDATPGVAPDAAPDASTGPTSDFADAIADALGADAPRNETPVAAPEVPPSPDTPMPGGPSSPPFGLGQMAESTDGMPPLGASGVGMPDVESSTAMPGATPVAPGDVPTPPPMMTSSSMALPFDTEGGEDLPEAVKQAEQALRGFSNTSKDGDSSMPPSPFGDHGGMVLPGQPPRGASPASSHRD